MNVSLNPHFDAFVQSQLASGRYHSASEVIREALRLLEDREKANQALRNELQLGIDSGPTKDFDPVAIKQRGRDRLAKHLG